MSFSGIAFLLSDISDITEILPFFVWLAVKNRREPYLILALLFLCTGIISLYGYFTANEGIHNMHLYHIWALVQAIFLYLFYSSLTGKWPRSWIIGLIILTYVASSLWYQDLTIMNGLTWTVNMLMIIYFGLSHLQWMYRDETTTQDFTDRPDFIITTGWLVYAAGALFAYLMGPSILRGNPVGFFKNAWMFQSISNIIKTTTCCYGFYRLKNYVRS